MLKTMMLAALLAGAGVLPAIAQGAVCKEPAAPILPDPAKATVEQMRAVLTGAQGFMSASDSYQECLGTNLDAQKKAATADKPFDPAVEKATMDKVDANQAMKQKVGNDANMVLTAFRKAHNCDGKPLASCS